MIYEKRIVERGRFKGRIVHDHAFEGVREFRTYAEERAAAIADETKGYETSWMGGTIARAMELLAQGGDVKLAEQAKALALNVPLPDVSTYKQEPTLMVAGGTPCIGAWASGEPQCMVNIEDIESDRSPLRIFVDTVSSAGVDADSMMKAGLMVSALADLLAQIRPVEVWACVGLSASNDAGWGSNNRGAQVFRTQLTTPFSLAEMAMMIGFYPITRGISYGLGKKLEPSVLHWPFGDYQAHAVDGGSPHAFGTFMNEQDVYVPGTTLHEKTMDVEKWLREKLAEIMRGPGKLEAI